MVKQQIGKQVRLGRVAERPFWLLNLSVLIRAGHQVGAAVFLSSYLVPGGALPSGYLILVLGSGVALVGTEAARHRQLYRESAGIATAAKLVLLGIAVHGAAPPGLAVLLAFMVAAVAAHLPKTIRHRLLI